jgi:hypothetical protein
MKQEHEDKEKNPHITFEEYHPLEVVATPADEAEVTVANHRLIEEIQTNEVNDRLVSENRTKLTTPINSIGNRN